ncbi:ABC transporter ATP-binding protein [Virgisporangium aurantiacum]|uniref:ABC transporter ATP-binding protein n=1 Tax=Virgisporangium aurantiacum TaxID=175570 RepID=A0A8J3ZAL9_9ACTN|nr:ABC transporter ATP-binding protein [Virgisporangium aurantiacum]GIJ60272.1 ABC transporter ATP-binding protein [Virgisporangium aurantiacum]
MTAAIELTGIGVTYPGPPPVHALRPCDLTVAAGEHLAVVGPSGSGKSTILNVLGLLDRPTVGRYRLDGTDVGALGDRDRTSLRGHRIGFVFQSFHLLPLRSAVENVALGQLYSGVRRSARLRAAAEALDRVGLAHRRTAVPATMSGGERQRVAIARALVHRPRVLLCDEPTGNLDTATARDVLALFAGLRDDGITIVMITHDPDVARRASRVVTIRDGVLDAAPV